MGNLITEFSNNIFAVSAVLGLLYGILLWNEKLTNGAATLIKALMCITVAIIFRIGWWALGLKLAAPGENYHPYFVEWKWVVTLPMALLFAYGILLFVDSIDHMTGRGKAMYVFACLMIAAVGVAI